MNPFKKQIGGTHYKNQTDPELYEFFWLCDLPFYKASMMKRALRFDLPTGKGIEDLRKIKHECDMLIELMDNKQWKKNRFTAQKEKGEGVVDRGVDSPEVLLLRERNDAPKKIAWPGPDDNH